MTYDEILTRMRVRYRELSGFDADQASDIGIRLKVLAAEAAELYERMSVLKNEIFPQTSTGDFLDLHAQMRGLARKPAISAQGFLRFSRETPAIADIEIPTGILCATRPQPQLQFETIESAVLPAGSLHMDIPARAVDAGALGNVAAKAVCIMISPAAGITGVTNPQPFTGGVDEESDDALRARLLHSYRNISNGTNNAFYYDLAMSDEGVSSANILPRKRGRGTVDVAVTCHSPARQNEVIERLQQEMSLRKEINVDVNVAAAVQDIVNLNVQIAVLDGYNFELVGENARGELTKMLETLPVGKELLLAELGSRLLSVDGIYNYRILSPAADTLPASNHVLRPGAITISRMAVGG